MVAHANVALRFTLGILLGFIAFNAFGGGAYGIGGAENVPRAWLFSDYLIPSMILLFLVGGSSWLATIALFADWSKARVLTLGASGIVLGWIVVQVAIIGYVSPLQPLVAITALLIGAAAHFLSVNDAAHSLEGQRSSTGARPTGNRPSSKRKSKSPASSSSITNASRS